MKKCRIGVIGTGRGMMLAKYCKDAENAELIAICDNWLPGLDKAKKEINSDAVHYCSDFGELLREDIDVVFLANFANEHAPFAIAAMEAGKNVISEVLPAETMAQAVALTDCVERTGRIYCYAENYCFMHAPYAMRTKVRAGELGEFEYGEGEYMHNCEPIWPDITHGDPSHWRNNMSAFFYCTHSVGPLLRISGLHPVSVTGFEIPYNARMARIGAKGGSAAIEMITLENGAILKSLHGTGCSKSSIWYSVYGSRGRMESAREDTKNNSYNRLYTNLDKEDGGEPLGITDSLPPEPFIPEAIRQSGHGGSDSALIFNAINRILGDGKAEIIDVYEALDMWMCGHFAYLSCLAGNIPMPIPDLRNTSMRDSFRSDNRSCNPVIADKEVLPSNSKGNPTVPMEIYSHIADIWKEHLSEK